MLIALRDEIRKGNAHIQVGDYQLASDGECYTIRNKDKLVTHTNHLFLVALKKLVQ